MLIFPFLLSSLFRGRKEVYIKKKATKRNSLKQDEYCKLFTLLKRFDMVQKL